MVKSSNSASTITASELAARLARLWPDFIQFALSQPRAKQASTATKIVGRVVLLKNELQIQFTRFHGAQQAHSNLKYAAALAMCTELFVSQFKRLHLFTATADVVVQRRREDLFAWQESPPTKTPQARSHDRRKRYLIPEDQPCPFLIAIGVMSADGKVFAAKYHKFRQINRFLELVDDVLPHLPADRPLQVVDFGSGKSYLTFALHHLLTQIRGRVTNIVGVDLKADVIRDCSRIAVELGCEGLSFQHGDIAHFGGLGQVDLMVCLHACDTATDAALAQAVRWQTSAILAVPCCQHELAALIAPDAALGAIEAHGILKERFAAIATDALRANLLEICGYQTQVLEFIDLEHTAKNLLIRALRRSQPDDRVAEHLERYRQLMRLLGTEPPYLARALEDVLLSAASCQEMPA